MATWCRALVQGLSAWLAVAVVVGAQGVSPARAVVDANSAVLSGSVVDEALTPLAGVVITVERSGHVVGTATTNADGAFTIAGLAPGDYRVRATLAGFTAVGRDLHIAAGSRAVTLPLVFERGQADKARETAGKQAGGGLQPPSVVAGTASTGSAGARGGGGGAGRSGAVAGGLAVSRSSMTAEAMPAAPPSQNAWWPPAAPSWGPPASGETYTAFDPNRFESTLEHPLSTFGADVDTASYSNLRRFLANGQLPPAEAVRVEELVNYFQFPYDPPRDGAPMAVTTEIGDCPWAPAHKLVLIGARASLPETREPVGRNIVLLIDVSGSMAPPERLPLIKTALGLFVDTLRPDDLVSIVTYAGTSGIALEPTPARDRDRIQYAISGLVAGGSTNGGQGLITAYRTAMESFIPGGVNRVILATDGDFNVGIVNPTDLVRLIEREKRSDVFLSVFGVGTGNLKDATMEMLADHGNGHYAYLDSLQEARTALARESDATLETVAKDVKFQVEFNPAVVAAWKQIGYEDRALAARDFNDDRKDGGEMGAGHSVTALYEVIPAGSPDDWQRPVVDPLKYQAPPEPTSRPDRVPVSRGDEWCTVKARYKLPESDTSAEIVHVARATPHPRFLPLAAAVADFGLLLRDGPESAPRWDVLVRRVETMAVPPGESADVTAFKDLVSLARGLVRLR